MNPKSESMDMLSAYKRWSDIGETIRDLGMNPLDSGDLVDNLNMVLRGCGDAIRDLVNLSDSWYGMDTDDDPEAMKNVASCMIDAMDATADLDEHVNDLKLYAQALQKRVGVLLLNIEQLSALNHLTLPLSKGFGATVYALRHPYEAVDVGVLEKYPDDSHDSHDMFRLTLGHAVAEVTALRTVTEQVADQLENVTDDADFEELMNNLNDETGNVGNAIDCLKEKLVTALENLKELKSCEISRCDADS